MKVAIIFTDGVKQINFTPENESEKQALKMITPDDNIELAVKTGSFIDSHNKPNPYSVEINMCRNGYLRAFSSEESIMLILTPKDKKQ